MKTYSFIIATVLFVNGYAFAAGPGNASGTSDNTNIKRNHTIADRVEMTGGIMVVVKDGFMSFMSNDVTMPNGIVVMKDGTYKLPDGSVKHLKEGDKMDMHGNFIQ